MRNHRSLPALAGLLFLAHAAFGQDAVEYRLPAEVTPLAEAVELRLDPARPDYSGRAVIRLRVSEPTDRIGIYQVDLDMTSIVLSDGGAGRTLEATVGDYDHNWLADGDLIPAGDYELTIEWNGKYSTDSLGMHRVAFEDNDYIFTQFEAMYARRAMPLFDEPSFKIPYQLTIVAPEALAVVSNTPVGSRTVEDGWQRVEFMETKPLPSYLLAYAVGPLDRAPIEGMSVPGFVYTPKGHADELGFVLRETPTIVNALEEYFGFDYPYRKLDFVAVPEFAFGAMENPGLITYRTDLMMVGDEASGSSGEAVLNVIAHEVAHIWYGDLVTMAWWDDLWLNEAFATWMARSTLARTYPQYESDLKLPQAGAFVADQRTSTKPIRKTVRTEKEITEDIGLNYSKGSAILAMLENYVGPDVWQRAIQSYVKKHAWGNATEQDLWAVVSGESGLDIGRIAADYLNQPGYATLTIDADGGVRQERYLAYGLAAPDLQWRIPLNVKYKKDNEVRETFYLLEGKSGSIDLPKGADWIFPDAGGNGYFRWQTDLEQFYSLVDDADALNSREKIALLDNSEALLNAGDLSLGDYLFVLNRFLADPHPLVFLPALEKVKAIGDDFVDDGNRERFARFIDDAVAARFATVGVETEPGDSQALNQMRPRLLRVLGQYGSDPSVRAAAAMLADRYLASPGEVASDLGREALRVTALADDGRRYDRYIKAYLASGSADQKTNILVSIYFDDPSIVRKHLAFTVSPDVPAGDTIAGLSLYSSILADHSILYEWLGENLETLEAKIPAYYHELLPQVMVGVCNETNLGMMEAFFGSRGDKYTVSLGKAVESMQNCIGRRERESAALAEFLARYAG